MASRKYDSNKCLQFLLYEYVIILVNQFHIYLHAHTRAQGPVMNQARAHVPINREKLNQTKARG
jgi:hypothetical protein